MLKLTSWPRLAAAITITGLLIIWLVGYTLGKPSPHQFKRTPDGAIDIEIPSQPNGYLSGWLFPVDEPIAAAILMHGIRSNRGQMLSRAKHLQSLGIMSLAFDFQAHGQSPGKVIGLGYLEASNAQSALAYLQSKAPGLPNIAIGVSMGGAAALLADPALNLDVLILEAVYTDIDKAIANRLEARIPGGRILTPILSGLIKLRLGVSSKHIAPIKHTDRITAATLILSGSADEHTTVEDTQKLYDALATTKSLYLFDNAGHVDLQAFDNDTYWSIVQPFIWEHLFEDS